MDFMPAPKDMVLTLKLQDCIEKNTLIDTCFFFSGFFYDNKGIPIFFYSLLNDFILLESNKINKLKEKKQSINYP